MTVSIQITSANAVELRAELRQLLVGEQLELPFNESKNTAGAEPSGNSDESRPDTSGPAAVSATAPAPAVAEKPKRGRGRPARTYEVSAPSPGAAPSADSGDSQPAVESNTGTAPAAQTPAAEDGVANDGSGGNEAAAPVAAPADGEPMSLEDFRAACIGSGGMTTERQILVANTLQSFGYTLVREVKAEDRARIVAKLAETAGK